MVPIQGPIFQLGRVVASPGPFSTGEKNLSKKECHKKIHTEKHALQVEYLYVSEWKGLNLLNSAAKVTMQVECEW
jgi:hypothetical protein